MSIAVRSCTASAHLWICQWGLRQSAGQVEGYINGTANLVKNLPQEVASLPQNVSFPVHTPACTCRLMPNMCSAFLLSTCICPAWWAST